MKIRSSADAQLRAPRAARQPGAPLGDGLQWGERRLRISARGPRLRARSVLSIFESARRTTFSGNGKDGERCDSQSSVKACFEHGSLMEAYLSQSQPGQIHNHVDIWKRMCVNGFNTSRPVPGIFGTPTANFRVALESGNEPFDSRFSGLNRFVCSIREL